MNSQLEGLWESMRELGLCALAHANRHAAYSSIDNNRWADLSVLQAAHAAEILIKARIAQEHPLLVFEKFPPMAEEQLSLDLLFEKGKTIEWNDLPLRLWATTGITLPDLPLFKEFGRLRNGIQHFAPSFSNQTPSLLTLNFIFKVIDPFINQCWGLYAIDYDEDYEPYLYFVSSLINNEILFLVSQEAAECSQDWDVDWSTVSRSYHDEMKSRIEKAFIHN